MLSHTSFIDQIYECAFIPELWPGVLAELANIAEARGGWFCVSSGAVDRWAASDETVGSFLRPLIESGWVFRTDRFRRLLKAGHSGFLVEHDIYSKQELESDLAYRNLLRPRGLGWSTATAIPLPTGDNLALALERDYARGPVEAVVVHQLDALRPHLARCAMMSGRLQLERARVASETLATIGLPALVLDEHGKVLSANQLIEALTAFIRWRTKDLIAFKNRAANILLRQAIEAARHTGAPIVQSFAVRGEEALMVAHILPIRRSARDIFVRCAAMLILTPVTRPEAPPVELVQSLFDLTAMEARVARNLASGRSVEDIASDGGTSRNTVRSHVRSVLAKTGCKRQVDVVTLLSGVSYTRVAQAN
jgi:DNA-binding CsgD family transcriptional regulator